MKNVDYDIEYSDGIDDMTRSVLEEMAIDMIRDIDPDVDEDLLERALRQANENPIDAVVIYQMMKSNKVRFD